MASEMLQQSLSEGERRRKHLLETLARADETILEQAWQSLVPPPAYRPVRGPETGIVMVRGRIGGGGAPFNLGEATVSRATIRLDSGEIGFGQVLGLSLRKAELIALLDGHAQTASGQDFVAELVDSVAGEIAAAEDLHARQTAATRVDFFTMVRGED